MAYRSAFDKAKKIDDLFPYMSKENIDQVNQTPAGERAKMFEMMKMMGAITDVKIVKETTTATGATLDVRRSIPTRSRRRAPSRSSRKAAHGSSAGRAGPVGALFARSGAVPAGTAPHAIRLTLEQMSRRRTGEYSDELQTIFAAVALTRA